MKRRKRVSASSVRPADLRAGNVKIALQRYINNECRIINLYNRYWAGPGNPRIDGTDACARVCGNSRAEEGEYGDDGNFTDTDAVRRACQTMSAVTARCTAAVKPVMMATAPTPTLARMLAPPLDVATASFVLEPRSVMTATRSTMITAPTTVCPHVVVTASSRAPNNVMTATKSTTMPSFKHLSLSGGEMSTGYLHSCFVKAGRVYCVGYGSHGQMGNGQTTSQNTSLQTVRNLTNITEIATGNYHNCAVKSDGTVWCWGYNRQGQLGDGSTTNRSSPVQVRGITDATKITAGAYHSCALRRGGGVKCWGYNPMVIS